MIDLSEYGLEAPYFPMLRHFTQPFNTGGLEADIRIEAAR